MDGRRGCFAGRRAGGENDKTIINRIMLRFRPIAPKPATGGPDSVESLPEEKSKFVTKGRAKRKYVKANKNSSCKRNKVERGKDGVDRTVLTPQLLPDIASRKGSTAEGSCGSLDFAPFAAFQQVQQLPWLSNFNSKPEKSSTIAFRMPDQSDLKAVMPPTGLAEWWVTVDCVTDTCMDGGELGTTDVERIKNLEADTCPGFISDGVNRVQWINPAYRKMVWADEVGGAPPETVLQLVVKVELPIELRAFACLARVQYTGPKEKHSQTVPCDVWRMDFGGFAWKLDVKAALNL